MTRIALLHPSGLLGSELRETLGARRELWQEIRLLTTSEEEAGHLTEIAGAAAMVSQLEPGDLDPVDVVFFCGGIEETRPLRDTVPASATAIVLSQDAAPEDGHPVVAGVNLETADRGDTILSPHPGSVFLAHLLHPLQDFQPERAAVTLLQPVSTYHRAALDEVFEQTRSILSFDPKAPRDIFPTQMAFNVVPNRLPAEHVVGHLHKVLASDLEVALQVLQAGVFHGYGASVHVKLGYDPGPEEVREALAEHRWNEMAADPELLGMVDAANRDEVLLGPVERDPSGGYRIWAVMDNLTRGGALNAIGVLEGILGRFVH